MKILTINEKLAKQRKQEVYNYLIKLSLWLTFAVALGWSLGRFI